MNLTETVMSSLMHFIIRITFFSPTTINVLRRPAG